MSMKKLLTIAALLLAFSPFANAQVFSHPDARNDRRPEMVRGPVHHARHAPPHRRHHMRHTKHRRYVHHR
jgi:hypothetical protein